MGVRYRQVKLTMTKVICGLLAIASLTSAQSGERKSALDVLLACEDNPCGKDVRPTCICPNGDPFSKSNVCPQPTCTCPDGETSFTPKDVEQMRFKDFLASDANLCGANNIPTCTCQDGSTYIPGTGGNCPGVGREKLPTGCTCPNDGPELSGNEFVQSVVQSVRNRCQ